MPTYLSKEKLETMRSIGFIAGGLPSKPRVKEWNDPVSGRMKAVKDEAGNVVTQHGNIERQDVLINPTTVTAKVIPKKE